MYALQYTPPKFKATWDCGKCTSKDHLSQRVLRMQASGPEAGRKEVFSGSDGGLSTGVWTGRFTGFSTTSSTLTLWILSEHSKPTAGLVCPATAPLLNPTHAPVHWPQQLRTFPFLNEDIIMDGLCQELPAYRIPALLVRKVFHSKLTAWKIWLPRKSSRVETERGWIICPLDRCREDGYSHRYSAFFCGCWVSSPYYQPPCQVSKSCIHDHQLCGDYRDASQQSSPRQ